MTIKRRAISERDRRLRRCLAIARILEQSRYGVCVRELSNRHSVSERSIQRDLNALDAAGWALREERGYKCCTWRMVR